MTESFSWDDLLKTADDAGFTVLPIGEYDVRIKTAEAVKAQSSGKDMIKVNMEVISGPHTGRSGIFNNFVLSPENPQAVAFFFRNLGAFGLTRDYFSTRPALSKVATDLVNRSARIKIGHREWNGQTQMDVQRIQPLPNGAGVTMPGGPPVPHAPAGPPMPPTAPVPNAPLPPTAPPVAPVPPPAPPVAAPTAPAAPTPAPSPAPSAPEPPAPPTPEQPHPGLAPNPRPFDDGSGSISRPAPPADPF